MSISAAEGWILDLHPNRTGGMTIWLKRRDGTCLRILDPWKPTFYVGGDEKDLEELSHLLQTSNPDVECETVLRHEKLQSKTKSKVLQISLPTAAEFQKIVKKLPGLGAYSKYRIYNADLPLSQLFLYERNLFPLCQLRISRQRNRQQYSIFDSIESVDYELPPLRKLSISLKIKASGPLPRLQDRLESIELKDDDERASITEENEASTIVRFAETVQKLDPDVIFTEDGGDFALPYLAYRASLQGVLKEVYLGREKTPFQPSSKQGNVYFSYGKIYHRPPLWRFPGRIHIDSESFYISQCGLEGAIEISRICRIPLQRSTSVTIGTAMTSIQLYQAVRDGILIPSRKSEPEEFKNAYELLVADRGGFYYAPKVGLHENVVEMDFVSMYPMLMLQNNLSAETVHCACCPDSAKIVPELGYNVCEKRRGIVPVALGILLTKRRKYKYLKKQTRDSRLRQIYDARQAALKWILVSSFGYLGFRNARFGKIDSHIAVCAFARQTMLQSVSIASSKGFELIHAIVDSLWLKHPQNEPMLFEKLRKEITRILRLPMNIEGQYRWIIFFPSKSHPAAPVLTRYFGATIDGTLKVRGIDTRRHDTPPMIVKCEREIIDNLAKAPDKPALSRQVPRTLEILKGYLKRLSDHEVELGDLAITKNLSLEVEEYTNDVAQAVAARQLVLAGRKLAAGQSIQYIFRDTDAKIPEKRIIPLELASEGLEYDVEKYSDLLLEAIGYILTPLGYDKRRLEVEVAEQDSAHTTMEKYT